MTVFLAESAQSSERYKFTLGQDADTVTSPRALRDYLDRHNDESLVVFAPEVPLDDATDLADYFRTVRPGLGFLLIRHRLDVSTLSKAMQAGIREVVSSEDAAALVAAARRSQDVSNHLSGAAQASMIEGGATKKGKVILVFSAKGGCGKTTVSTNLAEALAEDPNKSVALVDFDLQFGDVAVAMQLKPIKTISQAIRMQSSIDIAGIRSLMTDTHKPNMQALLAPIYPADVEFIKPVLADKIIRGLQQIYDYVVIDSPPAFTEVILKAFDLADEYLLITTLDMPSIKNLKVTLGTLQELGMPRSRWNIVINRSTYNSGLSIKDVEDGIGMTISAQIPNSDVVPVMVNWGRTVVAGNPRHPVSKAFRQLADMVSSPEDAAAKPKKRGWFGRRAAK